jgi:phosphatidylserine decarboxylase
LNFVTADSKKHAGRAGRAALKLIILATVAVVVLAFFDRVANILPGAIGGALAAVWLLFVLFTLYFFRDPAAQAPEGPGLVVSPGHGKVDVVDRLDKSEFMGGPCHRISIFLSVLNVHVQNAPISGKISCVTRTAGKFVSALQSDCAAYNENVLIGFDSAGTAGEKIGLRLIAGVLARRIVPFVKPGDELVRGERISLIQFGSRCDLYLPLRYKIQVKLGDKVVGGETIMASA